MTAPLLIHGAGRVVRSPRTQRVMSRVNALRQCRNRNILCENETSSVLDLERWMRTSLAAVQTTIDRPNRTRAGWDSTRGDRSSNAV